MLIQAVPETVKLVVEALVEIKLVPLKLVVPETVKFPPIYTLPEEWTERRFPGLVVPMPTLPPKVAKPEDRKVVVVALVVISLSIQEVSETVR